MTNSNNPIPTVHVGGTAGPSAEDAVVGNGVSVSTRLGSSGAIPPHEQRLAIVVVTDILNRWEGTSTIEPIWDVKPNARFVASVLIDPKLRKEVADFFINRSIARAIVEMIPTAMLKPGETSFTKDQVAEAIAAVSNSSDMTSVILELTLPALLTIKLVSDNIRYSRQVNYGFNRVTVKEIQHDVSMYQVLQVANGAKLVNVDPARKYSKQVFASLVAESFRGIGLAMLDIHDLSDVVSDLVKGTRAVHDPLMTVGSLTGCVPRWFVNNPVVQELSQNLVFIRAALSLPAGSSVDIQTDRTSLEKWAPLIISAIKSSEQFAWVSKAESLRHYGVKKVRDTTGKPVSIVAYRKVAAHPAAQAVYAIEDVLVPGAYSINASKDRIAEEIQSAYGRATFGTETGVDLLYAVLSDVADMGYRDFRDAYMLDAEGNGKSLSELAALRADRLYVGVTEDGVTLSDETERMMRDDDSNIDFDRMWEPAWWFSAATRERNLDILSGMHYADEVITSDPIELLLAVDEFEALDVLPARPQMLAAAAFNTRVVGFNIETVQAVDKKFKFDIDVLNVKMAGALRVTDFASMKSSHHTSVVRPFYNSAVIHGFSDAFAIANVVAREMSGSRDRESWINGVEPTEDFFRFLDLRAARALLAVAQTLSPSFRQMVANGMIERSITSARLSPGDAVIMRARLMQSVFGAYCDITALMFFFFLQGIETPELERLAQSDAMRMVAMEMGTDRKPDTRGVIAA